METIALKTTSLNDNSVQRSQLKSMMSGSLFLDIAQSLGLIIAAQLLINGLLIGFIQNELVLLPMLSSSGLLDLAFLFLAVCSVTSIVCHYKYKQSNNNSAVLSTESVNSH